MRLQMDNVVPTVIPHERSCERRAEPSGFRDLIAANVNPRREEETSHLVEHCLQKSVSLGDRRIEGIVREAVVTSADANVRRIPQLWNRLHHGITVSRDVDLRHDRDQELLGSACELGDIGRRIDDPVRLRRAPQEWGDGAAVAAPRSQFDKFWVTWDVEPPTLVIAEMKMKAIELPPSQKIEDPQ